MVRAAGEVLFPGPLVLERHQLIDVGLAVDDALVLDLDPTMTARRRLLSTAADGLFSTAVDGAIGTKLETVCRPSPVMVVGSSNCSIACFLDPLFLLAKLMPLNLQMSITVHDVRSLYWQTSHSGFSMAQNFGSSPSASRAGAADIPPSEGTALSCPAFTVDFSA